MWKQGGAPSNLNVRVLVPLLSIVPNRKQCFRQYQHCFPAEYVGIAVARVIHKLGLDDALGGRGIYMPIRLRSSDRTAFETKWACHNALRLEGFEPPTDGLEIRCSILLSYGRKCFLR